uniref:hypothetical protein n=1 Tax=Hassallia byssoidea TaxID=482630 RepID=UPI0007C711CC
MAHLQAKATTSNRTERKQQKLTLVKRLYDLGFERDSIIIALQVHRLDDDFTRQFSTGVLARI